MGKSAGHSPRLQALAATQQPWVYVMGLSGLQQNNDEPELRAKDLALQGSVPLVAERLLVWAMSMETIRGVSNLRAPEGHQTQAKDAEMGDSLPSRAEI